MRRVHTTRKLAPGVVEAARELTRDDKSRLGTTKPDLISRGTTRPHEAQRGDAHCNPTMGQRVGNGQCAVGDCRRRSVRRGLVGEGVRRHLVVGWQLGQLLAHEILVGDLFVAQLLEELAHLDVLHSW